MGSSPDPLHGITLEKLLRILVENYGWETLAEHVNIRCFKYDPSIKSSLQFLRRTPWARTKVEQLYVKHAAKMKPDRPIIQFGLDAATMDSCALGIVNGQKRATTGLYEAYLFDGEPLPEVGNQALVRDSHNRDIAIIEVTKVETRLYCEVDETFAEIEGAGDKSLAYWRKVHADYLGRECTRIGIPFNEKIKVVLEYIKMVKALVDTD